MAVTRTTTISSQTIVSSPAIKVAGTITVSRATSNTREVTSTASLTFTMGSASHTGYRYDVEMSFSDSGYSSTKKLNSLNHTWSGGVAVSVSPAISTGYSWTTGSRTMHIKVYKNESSDSKGSTLMGSLDVSLNMPPYEEPVSTYTITYNANSGSVYPTSETVTQGSSVYLPTPTRSGFNFTGWYNSSTYVGIGGSLFTPTGNVTLTADWEEIPPEPEEYTVYYNANGGSVYPTSETVEEGESVTLPTPTYSGFTFSGWYNGSTKVGDAGSSFTPTGNTNLTAHWQASYYTVYYNANGGASTPQQQVKEPGTGLYLAGAISKANSVTTITTTFNADGGTCQASASSTKTQPFTFRAWLSSHSLTEYQAESYFNEDYDVVMVAQWNNGTADYTSITLPTPTKPGYNFTGWYSGQTKIGDPGDSYTPTTSGTITAHWEAYTYTVTWNANGGSVSPATKTITGDEELGTLPTPTREGFDFLGWFTNSSSGIQVNEHTKPLATVTYYAHWETVTSIRISTGLGSFVKKNALAYVSTENGWKLSVPYISTENGWKQTEQDE